MVILIKSEIKHSTIQGSCECIKAIQTLKIHLYFNRFYPKDMAQWLA